MTEKERAINQEVSRWSAEVGRALVRIENFKRRLVNFPRLPSDVTALLPHSGVEGLRLLNLRAWALRYSVNLDFILSFLLDSYFAKTRRIPDGIDVRLGVSVAALTSLGARRALEEEIARAFPSGENVKAVREEVRRLVHPIDPLGVLPEGEEMIAAYGEAMERRQRLRRTRRVSKRAWRGNPDPVIAERE